MTHVNILSDNPRWKDRSILYYLYKWKEDFIDSDVKITFFYNHGSFLSSSADAGIILSRYFSEWQNIQKRTEANQEKLVAYLQKAKKKYNNLLWFDVSDGTGSTDFAIIKYVDVFLKKQVLKDRNYYSQNHGRKSVRIWLQDSQNDTKSNFDYYEPCPNEELHKIKVAWNLGLCDYRQFPGYSRVLSNYWIGDQFVKNISSERNYDLVFRGTGNYDNTNFISFQRNKVFENIDKLNGKILSGGVVSRKKYLAELGNSKICISPFGWGEICYRDFESFLYGCILVKPTVDYLDTFPNVYSSGQTYIATALDMSDIIGKTQYAIDNYAQLLEMATAGQNEYLKYLRNKEHLVEHFKNILLSN